MAQGALDGVRIVDLSFGVAGPMTTMTLSDQGAEVILVEPPGGHPFRDYGGYVVWDRGKKSVVLDLKAPGDRGKLLELLATADVLVESFAPGSMETLGLGYQQIKSQFPALVYCSITGYGRNNRSEQRPDIDLLVQARSGMQWEQLGWREGPIRALSALAQPGDFLSGGVGHRGGTVRPGGDRQRAVGGDLPVPGCPVLHHIEPGVD